MSRIMSAGSPTAAAIAVMMPTGTVAMYVVKRWWANRSRKWASMQREVAVGQLAVAEGREIGALVAQPPGGDAGRR